MAINKYENNDQTEKEERKKMEIVFTVGLALNPSFCSTQNDVSRDHVHEHFYTEVKSHVL